MFLSILQLSICVIPCLSPHYSLKCLKWGLRVLFWDGMNEGTAVVTVTIGSILLYFHLSQCSYIFVVCYRKLTDAILCSSSSCTTGSPGNAWYKLSALIIVPVLTCTRCYLWHDLDSQELNQTPELQHRTIVLNIWVVTYFLVNFNLWTLKSIIYVDTQKPTTCVPYYELTIILSPQCCLEVYLVAQSTSCTWREV